MLMRSFSHDGTMIATASHTEGAARVWDARSSKLRAHTQYRQPGRGARAAGRRQAAPNLIDALAFSATVPELYVAGQRWDLKEGADSARGGRRFQFEQTNSYRRGDGPRRASCASFLNDQSILFWDPAKAKAIQTIEPPKKSSGYWTPLAFFANGKLAARQAECAQANG